MATNIEIEAKVLITKDSYEKVLEHFTHLISKQFTQINYYIDSEKETLRKHGVGLRIRQIYNSYEITLKTPMSEGLLEKTESITLEQYNDMQEKRIFPDTKIKTFLIMLGFDVNELFILTTLKTLRSDIKMPTYSFSIDKNIYSNIVDYELEREGNNAQQALSDLIEICKDANIDYVVNTDSKEARALNVLNKK